MKYKLIIGGRKKYESLIKYLNENNIKYVLFDAKDDSIVQSSLIHDTIYVEYKNFFNPKYYLNYLKTHNIEIDQVINFRDQEKWIILDNELNTLLNLDVNCP